MLSLIPALLLLALHGPAAVERYGHEGRLPEALRALERVWTPLAQESADSGVSKQCRALASLAALTADPIFSKAVSELLGWDAAPADRAMPPDPSDRTDRTLTPFSDPEQKAVSDGYASCRRSRDGPSA